MMLARHTCHGCMLLTQSDDVSLEKIHLLCLVSSTYSMTRSAMGYMLHLDQICSQGLSWRSVVHPSLSYPDLNHRFRLDRFHLISIS